MYDLIIVGGGPAGAAAAVYAGRKKLKTLLITNDWGGQSVVSSGIENWIGIKSISGFDLAKSFEDHVRAQEGVEIVSPDKVSGVSPSELNYTVKTEKGNEYQTRTLIVTSGGRRRRLGIPGEDKFDGRGVAYCSTCDAPIFKDKDVAVVGGGNAGLEAVIDLFPYAAKIYIINRGPNLSGDPLTQEEVKKSPKVTIISNAETQEILGDQFVSGIKYLDKQDNQVKELALQGVFVEIGSVPNSEFMKGLVEMNNGGEIIVDHKTGATNRPGIFAAGDVTDEIYKQNNISAGDGVAAALSAYNYLFKIKKQSPAKENL
ncbi:MAG: FAD-dependent oxidoreductase [Parcubacteria group bacterium]|nr:FAD-dependent oxidoreductase [Parcubacteria group bacterium]